MPDVKTEREKREKCQLVSPLIHSTIHFVSMQTFLIRQRSEKHQQKRVKAEAILGKPFLSVK